MNTFHGSIECVQHGGKPLEPEPGKKGILDYANDIGVTGVQLSNFHLARPDGRPYTAAELTQFLAARKLRLDGISMHCLSWVHGTAWTRSRTIRKFIPKDMWEWNPDDIEAKVADQIVQLIDLSAEAGNKIIPMFWGCYYGLEPASGYPWGMWDLPDGDLIKEGEQRFVGKTAAIRAHANKRGVVLAHEIHPGTAALCADDFLRLVDICDCDPCLGVNADPTHCWFGEDFETRFTKVGQHVYGCHVKDNLCIPGRSRLSLHTDWKKRGMQFCGLGQGEINLHRYVQLMYEVGYPARYRKIQGLPDDATVPLVGEAESAHHVLDVVSAQAATYIRTQLCVPYATQSFEKDMGN